MARKTLRVGMIGAGGISKVHCDGWKLAEQAEVVAITDQRTEAAEARANEYDIADVESSVHALLKRDDIDAVDIVTPNRTHKPFTIKALQSGKHVLCEKPLALTAKEVDAMMAAAKQSGKKLMCAQHLRFQHSVRAMKEYFQSHPLGDVYYTRAWYNRRRLLPARDTFIYKKLSGGGPCIDIGVHILDLALHMMGNFEPVSVTGIAVNKLAKQSDSWTEWGWGNFDKKGMDVEDFAAGFVRFNNGATLSLECSFMLNMKPRTDMRIDLFGTKAGACWPDCEVFDHTATHYADSKISVREVGPQNHPAEVIAFAEAVRKNKPVPVPPIHSRAVMAILEALYKSAKRGREVKL